MSADSGGIRLHSDDLANATIAVECKRKYKTPFLCPLCNVTHVYKTVHLTFDNNGDVIVSKGVWNKDLKNHPNMSFTVENEVSNPPPIIIGATDNPAPDSIVVQTYNGRR